MSNSKAKVKIKVNTNSKKAIKPKMGNGTGGAITAKLIATVKNKK